MFEGPLTVTLADLLTFDEPVLVGPFPADCEDLPFLGTSSFGLAAVDHADFRTWLRLYLPEASLIEHTEDGIRFGLTIRACGGYATAEVTGDGVLAVWQSEVRLWDTLEKALSDWLFSGRPGPEQVSVCVAGRQRWAWFGGSLEDSAFRWLLPELLPEAGVEVAVACLGRAA